MTAAPQRGPVAGAPASGPGTTPISRGGAAVSGRAMPLDGNSVNLELEMAKLADNAGKFSGVAQVLGIRFRQLLHAIRTIE